MHDVSPDKESIISVWRSFDRDLKSYISTCIGAIKLNVGERIIEIIQVEFDFTVADINSQMPWRRIAGTY